MFGNDGFGPYAKHTQELEDIIEIILEQYNCENTSFTLNFDDDISDSDIEYIQKEVMRRARL